jgi:hypothetical protein
MPRTSAQLIEVDGPRGRFIFTGKLIGEATSHRTEHFDHEGTYAQRGERCFACRWFYAQIFEVDRCDDPESHTRYGHDASKNYLVITVGGTIIPGEHQLKRLTFTDSPYDVIEILTIRKSGASPYLPAVSARALAQAADHDDDLRDAYENRPVM